MKPQPMARFVVAMMTILFAACAAPRSARDPFTAPLVDKARVVVENQNWEAMAVYVVRNGSSIRVGIVDGLSTRTLIVPESIMGHTGEVELMGESRIGAVRHRLTPVPWSSGRSLHLTLGSQPFLSVLRAF
jgi:hypothetical protein